MIEHARQPRVPTLGHAAGIADRLLFSGVIINVEMLGLQRAEVEIAVLDFIAAEVLRLSSTREDRSCHKTGHQKVQKDGSRLKVHSREIGPV